MVVLDQRVDLEAPEAAELGSRVVGPSNGRRRRAFIFELLSERRHEQLELITEHLLPLLR